MTEDLWSLPEVMDAWLATGPYDLRPQDQIDAIVA